MVDRDSVIGVAIRYRPDGPGIVSRWGAISSAPVYTGTGALAAFCNTGIGFLSWG
jgi:hypothetical protein